MITTTDTQPENLRNSMVEHIKAAGHLHASRVEQAMRKVPRHLFVPDVDIEDAYANRHVTTKPGSFLRADDSQLCGFIPMLGDGQDGERTGRIDTDVALYWDTDQPIDSTTLQGVLAQPRVVAWSGATVVPNEPFDRVWLRLTGTERGTCRIAADPAAVDSGLCTPAIPSRSPAVVEGNSLAYFTLRRLEDTTERRWELGANGHGPAGPQLADRLCEQIRAWDRDRTAQPLITAYPASTPDQELPNGLVIDKQHIRLVFPLIPTGCSN